MSETIVFQNEAQAFILQSSSALTTEEREKVSWALQAEPSGRLEGDFVGPRRELISPWSTCACEILRAMGVPGVLRVECFEITQTGEFDPMLEERYQGLSETSLVTEAEKEAVKFVDDIASFNAEAGLALSDDEIAYLETAASQFGRALTDSEIFGFAQINSEHCRHKIFNGSFTIDGKRQPKSLFTLIKETSKHAPHRLVSAYKDNVAFIKGPKLKQFRPRADDRSFLVEEIESVISLKAETHNFPTTVEPFYGASTGSGGEIRDRMAGGKGSLPLVGSAVYMTSYPRLEGEAALPERNWKYQSPKEILIKASNGASDFGNKFGQPLITGSLLTFEGKTTRAFYAYDRCVMLAGGVGYAQATLAKKDSPRPGDVLVLLGGDNYRIGMAGGSVSSVDTGSYASEKERSAVQRANPEMQKRVYNVIRALSEQSDSPVLMIHDHGAGGHINCFSELLEEQGGIVVLEELPVGDSSLSVKELICNESQERMGLILPREAYPLLLELANREKAPCYLVGEVTGQKRISFRAADGSTPVDVPVEFLFANTPETELEGESIAIVEAELHVSGDLLTNLRSTLSLEAVACKDWLTNKVDRSVTGLVARQQCCGPLQLPLSNVSVAALDYTGTVGVAQALGHAPIAGLVDEGAGARLSVAEALTNIIWAPIEGGLGSVALSANWMWPAKRPGENARLYRAVEALSQCCIELGIPVPTGKDSLSMTMNYQDGTEVRAPGTVVVTAVAPCDNVRQVVTPNMQPLEGSLLVYVNLSGLETSPLGGSSYAQTRNVLGSSVPDLVDLDAFKESFSVIQRLVREEKILAGHDISSGGFVGALAEMCFAGDIGANVSVESQDFLFCEKPGVIVQIEEKDFPMLEGLDAKLLGQVGGQDLALRIKSESFSVPVSELRDVWFKPSFLLDSLQTPQAEQRFKNYASTRLDYAFPEGFVGAELESTHLPRPQAAILRDKGTNGDRELAYCLHYAGFDVRDITMVDITEGREDLSDISFLAFPGGFSHSDVLGAARGWAGSILYNPIVKAALDNFFARTDTLSLGVCNGCQLMSYLDAIKAPFQLVENRSQKFESNFSLVEIGTTNSIMLRSLAGSRLGVWVAHGEGCFVFEDGEYDLPMKYVSEKYPANPNGSEKNAAAICSADGRHLAMMPHLERSAFSWQWPYLPKSGSQANACKWEVSPWMHAFFAARNWLLESRS